LLIAVLSLCSQICSNCSKHEHVRNEKLHGGEKKGKLKVLRNEECQVTDKQKLF
jgi:hypothetical protein